MQCHVNNDGYENYRISPKSLPPVYVKQRLNVYVMFPKTIKEKISGSIEFLTNTDNLLECVTFTDTEPLSSLVATRLAAKSIINDLQIDDYNSKSSHQNRFIEQYKEDKKQELINVSIQYQILSPFTAFIGIETRTEQEIITEASSGEIILQEVPIEIRSNESTLDNSNDSDEDFEKDDDEYEESAVEDYHIIFIRSGRKYSVDMKMTEKLFSPSYGKLLETDKPRKRFCS